MSFENGGPDLIPYETPPCLFCGGISRVYLSEEQMARLAQKSRIQDAVPELTPSQREMILTGTHDWCWPPEPEE